MALRELERCNQCKELMFPDEIHYFYGLQVCSHCKYELIKMQTKPVTYEDIHPQTSITHHDGWTPELAMSALAEKGIEAYIN